MTDVDPDSARVRFDPALVTSTIVGWDDAAEALADPPMKLVVSRLPS